MLKISKLRVRAGNKEVVRGISLSLKAGETHVLMGPNGVGKTSLAQAIMGNPALKASGSIKLEGKELLGLPPDERARLGLFLGFQNPEEVEGLKVGNFIRKAAAAVSGRPQDLDAMVKAHGELVGSAARLGMDKSFISRELNVGFSGGEKKRLEILQMAALKPKAVILDEPDSGLDVDGIKLIASAIRSMSGKGRCFMIITHYPRILRHIRPDAVHVLAGGRIVKSGDAGLADEIEEKGYSGY